MAIDDAEGYARDLQIRGGFRLDSRYKLLNMTPFKSSGHSRRMKGGDHVPPDQSDEDSDYIILGAWFSVERLVLPMPFIVIQG